MDKFFYNRGFTLIETFVAVTILVFAVIGPLGLLARAINDGNYAKNQVTAYYLAQEGLEIVINQRDHTLDLIERDLLTPANWLNGLSGCENGCKISFEGGTSSCSLNAGTCRLYINDGLYTHDGSSEPSLFSRQIKVEELSPDKAKVVSTVVWQNKEQAVSFSLSTIIMNQATADSSGI